MIEDIIPKIAFRTAIPFGYLLFYLILILTGVWALKNIIQLLWYGKYKNIKLYFSLIILIFNGLYLYSDKIYDDYLELNPSFSESELIGHWLDEDSLITFEPEGKARFVFREEYKKRLGIDKNGEGYWEKVNDFNIYIGIKPKEKDSKVNLLRVIKYKNIYRIIIDDFDDPDMWDGHLGFRKSKFRKILIKPNTFD